MALAPEKSRRGRSNVKLFESGVVGIVHITPPINNRAAPAAAINRTSIFRMPANQFFAAMDYFFRDFSILAHVSRRVTVRLNTRASGLESRSTQKYPIRSNWKRSPDLADRRCIEVRRPSRWRL